ncbi:hypothetical protein OHA37_38585 [Streptomyces sp. NBC_00335]|nr:MULTISPECIES: hypothetical protein [unclassified Streptomyces]MCX5409750.1 hypothetical protein [Streptomyces sp. NBC_00086]
MKQDALAEKLEACAAEHLALQHLDPMGMAFDDSGVPGRRAWSDGFAAGR